MRLAGFAVNADRATQRGEFWQFQADYLAAYRSLKLTRDASGVLVVEFHSKGGPFTFTAQDHTEFVDAFYRIAQDRAGRQYHGAIAPSHKLVLLCVHRIRFNVRST